MNQFLKFYWCIFFFLNTSICNSSQVEDVMITSSVMCTLYHFNDAADGFNFLYVVE